MEADYTAAQEWLALASRCLARLGYGAKDVQSFQCFASCNPVESRLSNDRSLAVAPLVLPTPRPPKPEDRFAGSVDRRSKLENAERDRDLPA
jgi:hypothetical protein